MASNPPDFPGAEARSMPPGGGHLDTNCAFTPLGIALLTISDSRSFDEDKSGALLAGRIQASGHRLAGRALVRDEESQVRAALEGWIQDRSVQVILTTGGTGVTKRDITPEIVSGLLDKTLDGFGEEFRRMSFAKVGTSSLQSRALGGVSGRTFVFVLPGSPSACRDAWDGILRWQLDSRHRPCNLAEMLPRL